ncbi:MAG: plasma membrane localization protein [Bogoriella megaspora]|nr:MAG: plasma membrane localization protein [Bogoriella megaspora]
MEALRKNVRRKHQILILKCYPKLGRNNQEAKPNSSELSYLLYYASTRRSKLHKVGNFLEKRTGRDVWRGRTGNIQVTLQILRALIEKCPRDLSVYAPYVLRILRTILRSGDIQSCEDTVATFEAFCEHQDPATLSADQDYLKQFEEIVSIYAVFASKDTPVQTKGPTSVPIAVRFRETGLGALKAVVSSECLSADTSKQLGLVLPVVLENLYSSHGKFLDLLQEREQERKRAEKEQAYKRRQSSSTVRTTDTEEADPVAASGTTDDADKLAELEVGCLALSVLRVIFDVVNRGQLRIAASVVLRFLTKRLGNQTPTKNGFRGLPEGDWPVALFDVMCRSAPVQDRFVILVTIVETLIRSPLIESDVQRQLLLATIVGWLLSSDINFIGLSIMDVLTGFIQHILLTLQLGGNKSTLEPHGQQADALIGKEAAPATSQQQVATANLQPSPVTEVVKDASQTRIELLDQLRQCIADLATHIYYTDQISDMISAILSRLKPSPRSSVATSAIAVEHPITAIEVIAESAAIDEKPNTDGFFSFDTARITALLAVKDIILVANKRNSKGSLVAGNRNKVGFSVWEGTQWLLRDPNHLARRAYVDALLTWLKFEPTKADLRIMDKRLPLKRNSKKESGYDTLAKRAASNASRERGPKSAKATFLPLLHLAAYENALQYSESESEILLIHVLLSGLVHKLGVNAARSGLPMIWRLQEEIPAIPDPAAKVHIGSLVHGYLWALIEYFNIDSSRIGSDIESEISRRRSAGLWARSIQIPPPPLEKTLGNTSTPLYERLTPDVVSHSSLRPFDSREELVDRIGKAYTAAVSSPPSSPPGSPGRSSISMATLTASYITQSQSHELPQLPVKVREQLLSEWTRESCIATTSSDTHSTSSNTGSRTGRSVGGARQQLLAANGDFVDVVPPIPDHRLANNTSPNGDRRTRNSTSSTRTAPGINDLKRFLATPLLIGGTGGDFPILLRGSRDRRDTDADNGNDASSDSIVSNGDFSASEYSYGGTPTPSQRQGNTGVDLSGTGYIGRTRSNTNGSTEARSHALKQASAYQDTIGNPPEPSPSPNVATFPASITGAARSAKPDSPGKAADLEPSSPSPRDRPPTPQSPSRPPSSLGHHHVTADEAPIPEPELSDSEVPPVPPLPRGLSNQAYGMPGAFPATPALDVGGQPGDTGRKQLEAPESAPRPTINYPPLETTTSSSMPPPPIPGPHKTHHRQASAEKANIEDADSSRNAMALLRGAQQQLASNDEKTSAQRSGRTGSPVRDNKGYFFQETGLGTERPVTPQSLRAATPTSRDGREKETTFKTFGATGTGGGALRPTTPTKSAMKKSTTASTGTATAVTATPQKGVQVDVPASASVSGARQRSLSTGREKVRRVVSNEGLKRSGGGKRGGTVRERSRERGREGVDVRSLLEGIDGREVDVHRERGVARPPY